MASPDKLTSHDLLMPPLISLQNIVKNYRSHRVLDIDSLHIRSGVTGLLGPNGAGKSTLIKMLLGLVKVTSGQGTVLGHRLGVDARKIRSVIGYMPEDDCYIPGMSGVEVVQFAAGLSGLPSVEAMRRAHEILDFCDMKQERYRTVDTYSTGMRQKVKFAAAIVHDPQFLILDEPTSGLDPEEREALLRRIDLLSRDAHKSVLISTHILPDVQAICDSAIIFFQGKVRLNRPLEELNATADPTVDVLINHSGEAFLEDLQKRGLSYQRTDNGWIKISPVTTIDGMTSGGTKAEHTRFSPPQGLRNANSTISNPPDGQLAHRIWQSAAATNTTIDSLRPAMNSLETIFMDTVKEAARANS
jgi:ABC-2 type transport system ATP-binding protein